MVIFHSLGLDVDSYVSDVVRHLPAGDQVFAFTFIYMAVAGYFSVYETECQIYGLGDGVDCVGHCIPQVVQIPVRHQIIEDAAAVTGKAAAAVGYDSAVNVRQDKVVRLFFG